MKSVKPKTSEIRRLQLTGGSTFIVSLPKRWVVEHGLVAKDHVRVEWRPSGNLRIIPEASSITRRREVEIDLDSLPSNLAIDHLIAAYLSGAVMIRVRRTGGFSSSDRKLLRRFIAIGRGIEIVNETDKMIEIESLVDLGTLSIYSSLNRMYLLVRTVLKDVMFFFETGDDSNLDDIEERENEVDALRLLIERHIGGVLESASLEDSAGLTRWEAAELGNLVRTMERMGDHVNQLGILARNIDRVQKIDYNALPFSVVPSWLSSFRALNSNIKRPNLKEIHEAKDELRKNMTILSEYEESLWESSETSDALFLHRCSESIRRLCAYAIDMAEILLNIIIHKNANMVIVE
tara:strand:+ start:221 stop:1267 length:1047 start_codon:yes stop_codon:yes gene_type:complete